MVVSGVYQSPLLQERLILKGGNALRKVHLPLTRFSDDLDFSTPETVDPEPLLAELNEVCRFVEARTGVEFNLARNKVEEDRYVDRERQVFKARLYFNDFAGQGDHIQIAVRMDLTANDRLRLPVQTRPLIHPYSDANDCVVPVRVVQLEEVLADKLRCLLQRRYCFDLFDAVYGTFVSSETVVDRSEVVRVFLSKTIFGRSPGAAKRLLAGVPFELFRAFWSKVVCPAETRMSFDDAVAKLLAGLEDLFLPFGYGEDYERAYFPPDLRNPILEAGSGQKLIQMRYHGVTRLVEPYALLFKERKDGGAREYFYAFDRTGGRTSGPSIKSFVATDIQSLEVTSESFTPRFPVELSKAGGAETADRFRGRPGIRRLIGLPRRRSSPKTAKYVIECAFCGKRFYRQRFSLRVSPHKSRDGYACSGRHGFQVH